MFNLSNTIQTAGVRTHIFCPWWLVYSNGIISKSLSPPSSLSSMLSTHPWVIRKLFGHLLPILVNPYPASVVSVQSYCNLLFFSKNKTNGFYTAVKTRLFLNSPPCSEGVGQEENAGIDKGNLMWLMYKTKIVSWGHDWKMMELQYVHFRVSCK